MDLKKLLSEMTIDEKIGQLMQINGHEFINTDAGITGPFEQLGLKEEDLFRIGSILNFNSAAEAISMQDAHLSKDRNKIPLIFMMDVIHGYRTIYPIPLALGASFDPELMTECCAMASEEASYGGIHATFTPMVDYVRDARWGRVMETCGEDALLNSVMGVAQIKGFRGEGLKNKKSLATCVKHFAAYGGAEGGRDYNTVELSEHALREYYLPAYKACIDAGVNMVMPSFNTLNGVPSTANEWLMKKILRDEWGFKGVVISDYAAVKELVDHAVAKDMKEAAKLAFNCECDIEMCSNAYIKNLKELIEEGVFTEEALDEAVLRVLELKDSLGLFENPYKNADISEEKYLTEKNREIARRAAEESAVLLKNDNILPFSKSVKKIAVIGPFADNHEIIGFWSCNGRNEESITVAQGISALIPEAKITICKGCSNIYGENSKEGFDEAIAAAKDADIVILCIGEPQNYSGEGNCRSDLNLPGVQSELAEAVSAANPNTAAVIFSGRPNSLVDIDKTVPAILHMWFPGTEGGNAAANLLFGNANPGGKISMSFPKSAGQCPIYYNSLPLPRGTVSDDVPFLMYHTSYIDCGIRPLYPFGYGLSYSDFVYEDLTLSQNEMTKEDEITVSITIYNNSNVPGKETVMLFRRDPVASNSRPVQELIAFKKVSFCAKERKTVEFKLNEEMLRFWNNENKYVSEKGDFEISTGFADNLRFTKLLVLK